jgi:hypothetical protein
MNEMTAIRYRIINCSEIGGIDDALDGCHEAVLDNFHDMRDELLALRESANHAPALVARIRELEFQLVAANKSIQDGLMQASLPGHDDHSSTYNSGLITASEIVNRVFEEVPVSNVVAENQLMVSALARGMVGLSEVKITSDIYCTHTGLGCLVGGPGEERNCYGNDGQWHRDFGAPHGDHGTPEAAIRAALKASTK